jgi:hypothetical protein
MREILQAELTGGLSVPVSAIEFGAEPLANALVVALPTRAAQVRRQLPRAVPCITLRVRSMRASLEGQTKPAPDTVIAIVSASAEIRLWSRAMLIAVGLAPDSLSEVDAASDGWQNRVARNSLVIADLVAARELAGNCQLRITRVIADASLAELKQFCGL